MITSQARNILAQLDSKRSFIANTMTSKDFISFSDPTLYKFFEGGMREGELSEWGIQSGVGGREVLLKLLSSATQRGLWSLWVRSGSGTEVYPPAWSARGVELAKLRFAYTDQPVVDLKPLFMDSFFKLIVIDEPKSLTDDEYSFLARRAKAQRQVICIIKPYFLTQKRGNVWVKLRVNIRRAGVDQQICLQVIKGLSPRQISLRIA